MISKTAGLGGNVLGLDAADGPLINCLIAATWNNTSDDEVVVGTAKLLLKEVEEGAKKKKIYSKFKYLNYAYVGQPVIEGYGEENVRFLREVSKKYDPRGVFQRQVPGGFKLF